MRSNFRLFFSLFLFCVFAVNKSAARTSLHRNSAHHAARTAEIAEKKISNPVRAPLKPAIQPGKEWNIFVYIAGNNDLYSFIDANLRQMAAIGSNQSINIIVQVDKFGTQDVTRALVKKEGNQVYWRASNALPAERNAHPEIYNSGSVVNFIDFIETGMQMFPAQKQAIIIWNHGSGLWDPNVWRRFIWHSRAQRGMAFNDNYGFFLSNQDLTTAFTHITQNCLNGRPVDVLGLDICHGAQLETAQQLNGLINYMVASQESILASGWNYTKVLSRVSQGNRSPIEFCSDMVEAYRDTYRMTPDYTLSVLDMQTQLSGSNTTLFTALINNLDTLSGMLVGLLSGQQRAAVKQLIASTRKKACEFYDSEYIDLHLFILGLQTSIRAALKSNDFRNRYPEAAGQLQSCLTQSMAVLDLIYKVIPYYVAGVAFSGNPISARGVSIAYPTRVIQPSYAKTRFFRETKWHPLLREMLSSK